MRCRGFVTLLLAALWLAAAPLPAAADISRFVGDYVGTAEIISSDGSRSDRDMSVSIFPTGKDSFAVAWTSVTRQVDGRAKSKSYRIEFRPTAREDVYAAAMRQDVFGNAVQLNPMKGEPYVWARIIDDTLTVFSLYVDAQGGYDLQQFDRTLTEGGLLLDFLSIHNGAEVRRISTFLERK
ncbi:hypothetical protein ACFSUD_16085 [Sulfitobacter aestuarii]|uniref:Uncharacterized protein n=1 Tax=Sulfitobacter aestuarii TaxID=2161676 RepID=A0ABW5U8M5_9RHOB